MQELTMLNIDTLNALDDLNAETLYELEVKALKAQLSDLSREEKAIYVERARSGDDEARKALIQLCLHYVIVKAYTVYFQRHPLHVDPLDLVQEANLAMVEKIDKALEAVEPVTYLVTLAANAIQRYCTYCAPMIQRPNRPMAELAKFDSFSVNVESLDVLIVGEGQENQGLKVDIIEAPALRLEPDDEQRQQYRYRPLLEAVKRLNPLHRATIIRQYGLFGQPAETYSEIAESAHLVTQSVRSRSFVARQSLARALDGVLFQMLRPKPAPEED